MLFGSAAAPANSSGSSGLITSFMLQKAATCDPCSLSSSFLRGSISGNRLVDVDEQVKHESSALPSSGSDAYSMPSVVARNAELAPAAEDPSSDLCGTSAPSPCTVAANCAAIAVHDDQESARASTMIEPDSINPTVAPTAALDMSSPATGVLISGTVDLCSEVCSPNRTPNCEQVSSDPVSEDGNGTRRSGRIRQREQNALASASLPACTDKTAEAKQNDGVKRKKVSKSQDFFLTPAQKAAKEEAERQHKAAVEEAERQEFLKMKAERDAQLEHDRQQALRDKARRTKELDAQLSQGKVLNPFLLPRVSSKPKAPTALGDGEAGSEPTLLVPCPLFPSISTPR